jgi:PKD repeat protein
MKTALRFAFILCFFFLQASLFANTVIVKGTVKDSANNPIANKTVKIYSTDSTNGGCAISHSVFTNANGYYNDTLPCNGDIRKLVIIVESCNGNISHNIAVTGTTIENNFVICVAPPIQTPLSCKAAFTFTSTATAIKFNSIGSATVSGDSILSRTWTFGDSSASLTGNTVDPSHAYSKPGVYNACVTIKTKRGCESSYCQTVAFTPAPHDTVPPVTTNCKSQFTIAIQGLTVKFNGATSLAPSGDSIISRTWIFGDSSATLTGTRVDPSHTYTKAGSYTACLYIKTKSGCESHACVDFSLRDSVTVIPTNCKAVFTYTFKDSTVQFNSAGSAGTSADDSIISRTWYYSDSSTSVSLGGNVVAPSYKYAKPGTYTVYLVIKTKKGCESRFSLAVVIPPPPVQTSCKAVFTYSAQGGTIKFTSAGSKPSSVQDTIISRIWIFGDSTTISTVQGNTVDPTHTYAKSGKYTVILYIKTSNGCESKYSETVTVTFAPCRVYADFTSEKVSLKKLQFNSSLSAAQPGDSITQRNWAFGDNTVLTGNQINPVKEFATAGIYTTCLQVKTVNGCEAQVCKSVTVQDTITTPQSSVDYIKIISINPNPVVTVMKATIFSRNTNAEAEIDVYDIYGTRRLTMKVLLAQGNNVIEVHTESLYHGPYFLKVSTKNGNDSKAFYKL